MTGSQTSVEGHDNLGLDMLLRELLRKAIRQSGLSQAEIAKELTRRTGRGISPAMIANWSADSKEAWHIPAYAVPAICDFLRSDAIQRALLSPAHIEHLELGESLRHVGRILERRAAQVRELAKSKKAGTPIQRPKR